MVRIALLLPLLTPPGAVSARSYSLEWWTNLADDISVVEVEALDELPPLNDAHTALRILWVRREALRGTGEATGTFRADFHDWKRLTD